MKFGEHEISQLRVAYRKLCESRSELGSGSAAGEHYKIVALLKSFGCKSRFEASLQVMNFIEYAITYGKSPEVF